MALRKAGSPVYGPVMDRRMSDEIDYDSIHTEDSEHGRASMLHDELSAGFYTYDRQHVLLDAEHLRQIEGLVEGWPKMGQLEAEFNPKTGELMTMSCDNGSCEFDYDIDNDKILEMGQLLRCSVGAYANHDLTDCIDFAEREGHPIPRIFDSYGDAVKFLRGRKK